MDHIELAEKYGAHNYHPLPIVISKGEGVWVWDVEGKRYLDMLSSYSALNQGHRHPKIVAAMKAQLDNVTLTSRAFHNDKMGLFMKKLCEISGMEKVLLMNSGAEAVETAIKAARKWGYRVKGVQQDKAEIIVCDGNFHGRTTTIVGFSSEEQYKEDFGPFTPGFRTVAYGDADALAAAINENTVGFLLEPIQGEGGILMPPKGFISEARRICSENRVLLMADEIQTGLGRTGKMFAYEHDGIKPDILIVGKALGGGLYPVSAILSDHEIMDLFRPGDHGSTFGGNPLACACGIAALDVLVDEKLVERAAELGEYFLSKLKSIDSHHISEVRGKGLLIGLEIDKASGPARPFCEALSKRGILAKETHQQVIRFAPALVITKEEIDWVIEQVQAVLLEK